jgi:hypothetical protein
MGIWDAPGGGFPASMGDGPLARLLQSLITQRDAGAAAERAARDGSNPANYIEPPGAGMARYADLPEPLSYDR